MKEEQGKEVSKGDSFEAKKKRVKLYTTFLHRFFTDKSSEKEKQAMEAWDAEASWRKYEKKRSPEETAEEEEEIWGRLRHQLLLEKEAAASGKKRTLFMTVRSVAAITLLLLIGGAAYYYFLLNNEQPAAKGLAEVTTVYRTGNDGIERVILPDSSVIHLNRSSVLSYQTDRFNKKKREVWLEGEAFFEIARNPEKEFLIHTGQLITKVKGTSFNIKAYRELDEMSISVRDGKVEVGEAQKQLAFLTVDQQLTYSLRTNTHEVSSTDWHNAASWMQGGFVLNYVGARELSLRIRQYYNKELDIQEGILDDIRMKSSFTKETTFEDVMATLCELYHVRYKEVDGRMLLYKE